MRVVCITIMAGSIPGAQTMLVWSGGVGKAAVGVSCMPCRKRGGARGRVWRWKRGTAQALSLLSVTGPCGRIGLPRNDDAMCHRGV